MSMTKRFTAFVLALVMMLGCVTVVGYAADGDVHGTLGIDIKMGKIVNGEWTEVTEVIPGDEVRARVTLTTDFPCGLGTFMFFYDADFYMDEYESPDNLTTINPAYTGTGYQFSADIVTEMGGNTRIQNKVTNIIGAENQARYNWVYVSMDSLGYYNEVFDGSQYLFDIELKVKSNASGKGYFTVLPEIISTPDDYVQFFNLSTGPTTEYALSNDTDMGNNLYVDFTLTPDEDGSYTQLAQSENGLVITTKFFREENGEWVETEKAKRGETLKARVYLDSDYPTSSGELMFFYDKTFFTNSYGSDPVALDVNGKDTSFAYQNGIDGYFYTDESAGAQNKVAKMVSEGYISQPAANDGYIYVVYEFNTGKTNKPAFDDDVEGADSVVDNDLWLCQFDFTVAEGDQVPSEGDLVVNPDTIASEDAPFGAINVPMGYENSYDAYGMWLWDADVTLNSTPVTITSTVTFDADGGTVEGEPSKDVTDYIGAPIDAPADADVVKDGCTFLGWYEQGDDTQTIVDLSNETVPYDDITYIAKWADNVTVTFKDSEDSTITYYEKTGAAGSTFPTAEIANPTKSGYGFAGWIDENGDAAAVPAEYPATDATYFATWEKNTYPVTYIITNESTGATTEVIRNIAYQTEIPTEGIYDVPSGYEFDGWYTDASCAQGTELADGATMPAEAVTLYAKLTAEEFTVTFVLDGGKIGDDAGPIETQVPYMGTITAPGTPVKDHYTFSGWTPDLQDGAVLDTPADRTYTATWEYEPFTINYYKTEDDRTAGTVYETGDYLPGETVDSVADPQIDGQIFDSWKYYNADSGDEIDFTGSMPAYDVDAVAQYTPIEYTLTINYYEENTTDEVAPQYTETLGYGDTYNQTSPTVDGFKLVDDSQTVVTGTVNNDALDDPGDPDCTTITVNVYYTREEYTITWILNGGKIGDDEGPVEQTYAYQDNVVAPDDPVRTGYEFDGWLPDQIPATMPYENLEFTAQWNAKDCPLTFHLEGGKYNGSTDDVTDQVAFDSDISPLDPKPTRDGYTFQGWSLTSGGAVLDSLGKMDDENGKEFYAVWLADNAPYFIDVYRMGTDGNYPDSPTQTYPGEDGKVTDDRVEADPDDYLELGFEFDPDAANVLEGVIPATGDPLHLAVYYKRISYPLNITYVMSDNNDAVKPDDVVDEMYLFGADYSVTSPDVTGYTPDVATVEGTMGEGGFSTTVTYTPNKYALNITYVMSDDNNAVKPDDVVDEMYDYNADYSVTSPTVTGYTPDIAVVEGTMDENGYSTTVTYTPNNYALNITYVMADGNDAVKPADVVNEMHAYNTDYSVTSPSITGYTPDVAVVEGTMDENGRTETVTYSPNPHTVTWNLDGGKIGDDAGPIVENKVFGNPIAEPGTPVKDGYTFKEWTPALAATVADDDYEYTATYTPNEYPVTFVLKGGKYNDSTDDVTNQVAYGSAISPLDPEPTKEGAEFLGWSATDGGQVLDNLGTMDTFAPEGKTFYAVWSTNSYPLNITYVMSDDNNDVKPDDVVNQMVPYGDDFNVPSPAVEGYTPDVAAVEGTMDSEDGRSFTVTYSPNKYNLTVNYVMSDGHDELAPSQHEEQVDYNADYSVTSPNVTGYTPDVATVEGTMDDVNGKTETVTYSPVKVNITIHYVYSTGGTASPDVNEQADFNSTYTKASPEIEGYTPDIATVEIEVTTTGDIERTVTYTAGEYTLTINYVDNNGNTMTAVSPNPYTGTYSYGASYEVDTPSVTGYTPDVEKVTGTMDNVNGKTETVTYTPNAHTVTWVLDGGNISGETGPIVENKAFGDAITAPGTPEKEGYTFSAWTPSPAATVPDENVTYTATYTPNQYDATFYLEGGKIGDDAGPIVKTTDFNAAIEDPGTPTKDGYTFRGWGETADATSTVEIGIMDNINGKEFYALWNPDNASYNIEVYRMGTDGQYPATASDTIGKDDKVTGETASVDPDEYLTEGFTYDDSQANITEGEIPATGTLTLKLYYKRDQHNAIFMSDGSEYANDPYYYGQDIEKPATDPTKEHSHFLGWSDTEGGTTPLGDDDFGTMGTDDATFYAIFEANTYDIIYKFDGAKSTGNTNTDPADIENTYTFDEVEYGEPIPTINNPASEVAGYSFVGWIWYELADSNPGRTINPNTEDPGDTYDIEIDGELRHGTKIAEPSTVPENDVLAVALFKAPGKAMFYYGKDENGQNDSTRLYDQTTGANDTPITVPATDPTIEGYNFLGWCERGADGQPAGDVITDFGNYETGNDKKFVAKWEEIPAYANFYANGGEWSNGEEPVRVQGVHSQAIEEPTEATLSKPGYTFVGWGDSATATEPVDSLGNFDRDSEKDFYAIWEENKVTFDANGGKIEVVDPDTGETTQADLVPVSGYDEGDDVTDRVNEPTRPGYTFDKWVDEDGNEVDPTNMPGGDLGTVKAQWTPNDSQNINYYDDEGNLIEAVPVPEGAETPELGKDADGKDIDPSKPGKEFVGWVDENGDPVTLPDTMPTEPINVYAKYNDIDYTLTFDPNGGSWGGGENPTDPKSETKHYGDPITKPADPVAPDENHYFAGWSLDGTNVVNVESTMPAKDLTYKAVWKSKADKHTVTYKDDDGTTIETKEAEEGMPVPKISDPKKPGYIFTGWKWTDSKGKEIDTPYTMPNEDITATATYAPIRPTGSGLVVVGHGSARDGSPNEYSGEYHGEYAAPNYSMKPHIDAARPAEKPADHGEAIPQTGSNETAAIFAIVSAAAAAAYVVFAAKTKKKEDEE